VAAGLSLVCELRHKLGGPARRAATPLPSRPWRARPLTPDDQEAAPPAPPASPAQADRTTGVGGVRKIQNRGKPERGGAEKIVCVLISRFQRLRRELPRIWPQPVADLTRART
jgi:hypothetical protein